MQASFRELMDKLGIPKELSAYETYPFNVYDAQAGRTCSAEARMDMDAGELQGEIQLMHDAPPAGTPPMEQIIWFSVRPTIGQNDWTAKEARIKGQPIDREIYDWEGKCCLFFGAVIRFLKMDQVPDLDGLLEETFHSRERFGGQYGGGGGKSPKIKPGQLLGIKKGQGF